MLVNRVKGLERYACVYIEGGESVDPEIVITFLENERFVVHLYHGRQNDSRTTASVHGKYLRQERVLWILFCDDFTFINAKYYERN